VIAYVAPPGNDKIMRLHAQTAVFENGLVILPTHAPWLADYVAELTGFPGVRYDDQVDSTTQALDHLRVPSSMEIWAKLARHPERFVEFGQKLGL
jgi:predicted phage terminase large subunit-like protein